MLPYMQFHRTGQGRWGPRSALPRPISVTVYRIWTDRHLFWHWRVRHWPMKSTCADGASAAKPSSVVLVISPPMVLSKRYQGLTPWRACQCPLSELLPDKNAMEIVFFWTQRRMHVHWFSNYTTHAPSVCTTLAAVVIFLWSGTKRLGDTWKKTIQILFLLHPLIGPALTLMGHREDHIIGARMFVLGGGSLGRPLGGSLYRTTRHSPCLCQSVANK